MSFSTVTRPTEEHPDGKVTVGTFDILTVSEDLHVISSSLDSDADQQGPQRLAKEAYPIAVRPFVAASILKRLIQSLADACDWSAISMDAYGYDRWTRRLRRDMMVQPIEDAAQEMAEQQRHLHRTLVSFRDEAGVEHLQATVDRDCASSVRKGDVRTVMERFVVPAAAQSLAQGRACAVTRAASNQEQNAVQLTYPTETFGDIATLRGVCDAVRSAGGLSVTAVHLNPYLQAQILDYLTGSAVELLVLDDRTVSLVPRSERCAATIERVVTTLSRFCGETDLAVVGVMATHRPQR